LLLCTEKKQSDCSATAAVCLWRCKGDPALSAAAAQVLGTKLVGVAVAVQGGCSAAQRSRVMVMWIDQHNSEEAAAGGGAFGAQI